MKQIQRDHSIINYRKSGNGDITLVFVHGSYIDQSYWEKQVSHFNKQYTVVTLDLPGQGQSGKDRKHWSLRGFAEDVYTVIKELELKNVILIGHSMGAGVNLIVATSYPESILGFIAIDFFKNAATPLPAEYQQQIAAIKEGLKTDFAGTNEHYARMVLLTDQTAPEITTRVIKDYRNAYHPMGIEIMPEIFDMYKTEQKLLPQLVFKLNIITVDYMPLNETPLKKYAGDGYDIQHMKGTCHFPMLEDPTELNKLLASAIDSILKTSKAGARQKIGARHIV